MSIPHQDRIIRVTAVMVLILTLGGPGPVAACDLPLDPYVVALPEAIDSAPVNQFHGWVDTPEGPQGYLVVPKGANLTWTIYWDPTQGGQPAKQSNLKALKDVPPAPGKSAFQISEGGPEVKLYDLDQASIVLRAGMNNKPMKISEVYGVTWDANKNRVTAPWEIPAGNTIKTVEQPGGFTPTLTIVSGTSQCASDLGVSTANPSDFVAKMFGTNDERNQWYDGNRGAGYGQNNGRYWRISQNPLPEWKAKGGTWDFKGVRGLWNMDMKKTGKNQQVENNVQGTSYPFSFDTPSEPFFYYVRPVATFEFEITMGADEFYEWQEEQVVLDDTGNVTDSPTPPKAAPRTVRLTASGLFSKGGAGQSGGVATMVMVRDTTQPLHVHNANPSALAFTGEVGKSVSGGGTKFTIVEDNPYAGFSGTLPTMRPKTAHPPRQFARGSADVQVFYSMPVNEFESGELSAAPAAPAADFDLSKDAVNAKFVKVSEKWKWFRSSVRPKITWKGPYADSANQPISGPAFDVWGCNGDPAFTVGEVDIPASTIEQPLPIHQIDATKEITDGNAKILEWKKRFKFLVVPKDSCDNAALLTANGKGFDSESPDTDTDPTFASEDAEAKQFEMNGDRGVVEVPNPPTYITWQQAVPGCNHTDRTKLGTLGVFGDFQDRVKPTVILLAKDTKYDRTYIFNDHQQGWQSHTGAKAAYQGGTGSSTDNTAWPGVLGNDVDPLAFDALTSNPGDFGTQVQSGLVYEPPSTRKGIWVDEDTRLVFQVLAWDNINWKDRLSDSRIRWFVDDRPADKMGQDQGRIENLGNNKFEYVFRDPNQGPNAQSGDAIVRVEVDDEHGNQRKLNLKINVASNQLKILTLEETRRNR